MFGSFDIWPNETVYVERQKRVEPVWLTEKLIKIVIQHRSPEDLLPLMMRLRSLCDIPLLLKQLQAKGLNNVAERYAREGVSTPP